jgi:Protein of unknown function (DUF2397)
MRVFYLNKTRDIGLQLSPAQVADRPRSEFGYALEADSLASSLETLSKKGALRADQDIRWRALGAGVLPQEHAYDITRPESSSRSSSSRSTGLRDETGELDASRLLSIRDALGRVSAILSRDDADEDTALHDLDRFAAWPMTSDRLSNRASGSVALER